MIRLSIFSGKKNSDLPANFFKLVNINILSGKIKIIKMHIHVGQ